MLEILLIILAWRKGWRWKALIPTMVTVFIVILSGAAGGEGASIGLIVLAVIGDFTALITMSCVEPSKTRTSQKLQGEAVPKIPEEMKV